MTFKELLKHAERLGAMVDTDWAEENSGLYDEFDKTINYEYDKGNLTDVEFNELAMTAFFDYFDLKGADENET